MPMSLGTHSLVYLVFQTQWTVLPHMTVNGGLLPPLEVTKYESLTWTSLQALTVQLTALLFTVDCLAYPLNKKLNCVDKSVKNKSSCLMNSLPT